MSLLMVVPVVAPIQAAVFLMAAPLGACSAAANVIVVSMRQRLVPSALLGRANATYRLIGMGGIPIGALAGGVIAQFAGLPTAFFTGIALCLLSCAIVARHVTTSAVIAAECVSC